MKKVRILLFLLLIFFALTVFTGCPPSGSKKYVSINYEEFCSIFNEAKDKSFSEDFYSFGYDRLNGDKKENVTIIGWKNGRAVYFSLRDPPSKAKMVSYHQVGENYFFAHKDDNGELMIQSISKETYFTEYSFEASFYVEKPFDIWDGSFIEKITSDETNIYTKETKTNSSYGLTETILKCYNKEKFLHIEILNGSITRLGYSEKDEQDQKTFDREIRIMYEGHNVGNSRSEIETAIVGLSDKKYCEETDLCAVLLSELSRLFEHEENGYTVETDNVQMDIQCDITRLIVKNGDETDETILKKTSNETVSHLDGTVDCLDGEEYEKTVKRMLEEQFLSFFEFKNEKSRIADTFITLYSDESEDRSHTVLMSGKRYADDRINAELSVRIEGNNIVGEKLYYDKDGQLTGDSETLIVRPLSERIVLP